MLKKTLLKKIPLLVLIPTVVLLYSYLLYLVYYYEGIFPGVAIASYKVGGLTSQAAEQKLQVEFQKRVQESLKINFADKTFIINLQAASPELDTQRQAQTAYKLGRSGATVPDFAEQMASLFHGTNLPLNISFRDEEALTTQLKTIAQQIKKDPLDAQLVIGEEVTIIPSQEGQKLNENILREELENYLALRSPAPKSLPLKIVQPNLTTEGARPYQAALIKTKTTPLKLSYDKESWTIDQTTLYKLLAFPKDKASLLTFTSQDSTWEIQSFTFGETTFKEKASFIDPDKLADFLDDLAQKINQPAQDARFIVENNPSGSPLKVKEFQAAKEGRELDINQTADMITSSLQNNTAQDINLPVKVIQPKVTATDANKLGIKEYLGQGVSHFSHSIANRIYNVNLGASRLNGALVPPGETFSFNKTVGEVSGVTGYKPAYVIKSGRTVLDDGGGICQVSSTLFRAILNTGLPIIERTAHAYRVGYYEEGFPPGLDATVFAPSVDLKFKNDTPGYLLIQAYTKGLTLYVDFYGTSDSRVATLSTPVVANQTPPPPDLRQDDPTLPKGEIKQVDWSAWGANVSFNRKVVKNGETIISETWRSNYKPWQAIFLVGTKEN